MRYAGLVNRLEEDLAFIISEGNISFRYSKYF